MKKKTTNVFKEDNIFTSGTANLKLANLSLVTNIFNITVANSKLN